MAWLPTATDTNKTYQLGAHDGVGPVGTIVTGIHALTFDIPSEGILTATGNPQSLADYDESGYRLERFVGKFHAALTQYQDTQAPKAAAVAVCAGLIVLRVDDLGVPLKGLAASNDYSPLSAFSERDPWVWRRLWVLGNSLGDDFQSPSNNAWSNFPRTTGDYGSIEDGPHIDTSSKRRVGTEERLFFIVSSASLHGDGTWNLRYLIDYRILAVPLKMTNRRNASR